MGNIGASQVLIVLLVFVVLFGARRLPAAAKGLGESMRIFRSELREGADDTAEVSQQGDSEQANSTQSSSGDTTR